LHIFDIPPHLTLFCLAVPAQIIIVEPIILLDDFSRQIFSVPEFLDLNSIASLSFIQFPHTCDTPCLGLLLNFFIELTIIRQISRR
jgi:hypothetical protein